MTALEKSTSVAGRKQKLTPVLAPQQVNSSIVALGEMAIAAEQETIALCDGKGHIA